MLRTVGGPTKLGSGTPTPGQRQFYSWQKPSAVLSCPLFGYVTECCRQQQQAPAHVLHPLRRFSLQLRTVAGASLCALILHDVVGTRKTVCKPKTLLAQEMRQRATKCCRWEIIFMVCTIQASLSPAAPPPPRSPCPLLLTDVERTDLSRLQGLVLSNTAAIFVIINVVLMQQLLITAHDRDQ
jgi:hypothetical protein